MMMKKLYGLILAVCLLGSICTGTASNVFVPASNPNITYMGRVSKTNPEAVRFTYPGVSVCAAFEGTSLQMKTKPGSGAYMVEIDALDPYRIQIGENDSIVSLAEGLPAGTHQVRLMYAIEGYELKPEFYGFYLDEGCHLVPMPELPVRRIEFIGDSMTCGYGVESENPKDPFTYETENHYYTYAAETARALQAQHLVVARSGIGIYRNYNGPREGNKDCMPAMYEQTLFMNPDEHWEHRLFVPDVVCVNLGTNDVSTKGYDKVLLQNAYRDFVGYLRKVYPQAKLVLLTGSMLNGKGLADVKEALDTVTAERQSQGDMNVFRFDMSPQNGSLGYGASYHPSRRQHQKMALELTAYLRKLMVWN